MSRSKTFGANVLDQFLEWNQVICAHCGQLAGEYKYHTSPGLRDAASWTMRCVEDYHTQEDHRIPVIDEVELCLEKIKLRLLNHLHNMILVAKEYDLNPVDENNNERDFRYRAK